MYLKDPAYIGGTRCKYGFEFPQLVTRDPTRPNVAKAIIHHGAARTPWYFGLSFEVRYPGDPAWYATWHEFTTRQQAFAAARRLARERGANLTWVLVRPNM